MDNGGIAADKVSLEAVNYTLTVRLKKRLLGAGPLLRKKML